MKTRLLILIAAVAALVGMGWGALRVVRLAAGDTRAEIPTTSVKKGRVTIIVAARGDLQGGNSEMMTAPMAGGGDLVITDLREPGEFVNPGDVVAQFDTTQQEFNLREAEADLAEAEQQVKKAEADAEATLEEARYQMLATASDVKQADLEIRKNSVVAAIVARQNDIALEAARNRQKQAEQDFENKKKTATAGIAIQRAAVQRSTIAAQNAQRTIDNMILKAK